MSLEEFKKIVEQIIILADQPNISSETAAKIDQLIVQAKIQQISLNNFDSQSASQNIDSLQFSRFFYEVLILYYLKTRNIQNYELTLPRIKVYYEDLKHLIGISEHYYKILGLRLLYLLSFNKMGEFHSLLETITPQDQQNQYINFPVRLERSFQVGNYSSVIENQQQVPDQLYNVFLERILETIRYELGRSAEKAYKSISIQDALNIFHLENRQQIESYVRNQAKLAEENGCRWIIEGDRLYFNKFEIDRGDKIDGERMIKRMLNYAQELEKII